MPNATLADHLFGGKDGKAATGTAARCLLAIQWAAIGKLDGGLAAGGDQSGGMTVAKALGSIALAVACLAVNVAIGAIAGQHRVEWTMAIDAAVAPFVPHLALGQLLLGGKDSATATRAALAFGRLDRGGVRIDERATGADLIFGQAISLQETGAAGKSIAMWTPLLAIASPAVDIAIGAIAGIDRVQSLVAVFAVVALLVPLTALGQFLLGGKDGATATRTTLAGACPNLVHLNSGTHRWCTIVGGIAIGLESAATLTIAIALGSELLGIAALAVDVLIGRLAAQNRVEALLAGAALEALLVPAASACQHLFGGIDIAAASGTALTLRCPGNGAWLKTSAIPHHIAVLELCATVHGECAGTSAEAVTLRSIFASVAHLAEEFPIVL